MNKGNLKEITKETLNNTFPYFNPGQQIERIEQIADYILDSDSSSSKEPSDKPIFATNRSTNNPDRIPVNSGSENEIIRSLDGIPFKYRGSREKPSVLKYPIEIGTGEVPYVMQFRVFWRWENKDIRESIEKTRVESDKTLSGFKSIKELIDRGSLTPETIETAIKNGEDVTALREIFRNPEYVRAIDPNLDKTIENLLLTDPERAKYFVEESIRVYQNKVSNVETQLNDGVGRAKLDASERDIVTNRLLSIGDMGESDIDRIVEDDAEKTTKKVFEDEQVRNNPEVSPESFKKEYSANLKEILVKWLASRPIYDQMVSIYLPYCTKINNEDLFQYEASNQSIPGGILDAFGNIIDAAKGAAYAAGQLVGDAINAGTFTLFTGRIINPRLEKIFKQKDFRTFNFSWEFYPRNKKEVDDIRDIIETFRYHAHPAKDTDQGDLKKAGLSELQQQVQIILRVPAEFEIRFLSTNPNKSAIGFVENEYIPKIARCALSSISVDYTPNGIYSALRDNSPSGIVLNMQFTEMGILTRDGIDRGY